MEDHETMLKKSSLWFSEARGRAGSAFLFPTPGAIPAGNNSPKAFSLCHCLRHCHGRRFGEAAQDPANGRSPPDISMVTGTLATSSSLYCLKYTLVPSERTTGAASVIPAHASPGDTAGMVLTLACTKEKPYLGFLPVGPTADSPEPVGIKVSSKS